MTDLNDKIAEKIRKERLQAEQELNKPKKVSNRQVKEARIVWMSGVALIDLVTAWLILQVTGFEIYAVIWVLAGAGGLLYSERLKERVGNNQEQGEISTRGVNVSAGAVALMAILAGTAYVTNYQSTYMNAGFEIFAVLLFLFHLYQSYIYHLADEEEKALNQEARFEAQADREIRETHRAARKVETEKLVDGLKGSYREEHGKAFDAAYGLDVEDRTKGFQKGGGERNP